MSAGWVPVPPSGPRWPLSPLTEVPVEDAVGETLAADADALQHAIAAELVHHQGVVHHTWVRKGDRWQPWRGPV